MYRKKRNSITTDKRGNSLSVNLRNGGQVVKTQKTNTVKQLKSSNEKCLTCSKPLLKLNSSKAGICVTCLNKESKLASNKSKKSDLSQPSKQSAKPASKRSSLKSNSKSPVSNNNKTNPKKDPNKPSSSGNLISSRNTNVKATVTDLKNLSKTKKTVEQKKSSPSLTTSNTSSMSLRGNKRSYVHLASGHDTEDIKEPKKRKISENDEQLTKRGSRNKKPTAKGSEWLNTVRSKRVSNYQESKSKKESLLTNSKSPKSKSGLKINESKTNTSKTTRSASLPSYSNQTNKANFETSPQTSKIPPKRNIKNKEKQNQLPSKSIKPNSAQKKVTPSRKGKNMSLKGSNISVSKSNPHEVKQENLAKSIKRKFNACFTEKSSSESSDLPENVMIAQYILDSVLDTVPPSVAPDTSIIEENNLEGTDEPNHDSKTNNTNCVTNTNTDHLDCNMDSDLHVLEYKKNKTVDKIGSAEINEKEIKEENERVNEDLQSMSSDDKIFQLKMTSPEKVENCVNSDSRNSLLATMDSDTLDLGKDKESDIEKPINTDLKSNLKLGESEENVVLQSLSQELIVNKNIGVEKLDDSLEIGCTENTISARKSTQTLKKKENDLEFNPSNVVCHINSNKDSTVADSNKTFGSAASLKDTSVDMKSKLDLDMIKNNINLKDPLLVEDDKLSEHVSPDRECNGQFKEDVVDTLIPSNKTTESEQHESTTVSDKLLEGNNLGDIMINLVPEELKENRTIEKKSNSDVKEDCVDKSTIKSKNINLISCEQKTNVNNDSSNQAEITIDLILKSDRNRTEHVFRKPIDNPSSSNEVELVNESKIESGTAGSGNTNDMTVKKFNLTTVIEKCLSYEIKTGSDTDNTMSNSKYGSTSDFLDSIKSKVRLTTDGVCERKDIITGTADSAVDSPSKLSTDKKVVSREDVNRANDKRTSKINDDKQSPIICDNVTNKNELNFFQPTDTTDIKSTEDSKAIHSSPKKVEYVSELLKPGSLPTPDETSFNINESMIESSSNKIDYVLPIESKPTNKICNESDAIKVSSCNPLTVYSNKAEIYDQNQSDKNCLTTAVSHESLTPTDSKKKNELCDQRSEIKDSSSNDGQLNYLSNDVKDSSGRHNEYDAMLVIDSKATEMCDQINAIKGSSSIDEVIKMPSSSSTEMFDQNSVFKDPLDTSIDHDTILPIETDIHESSSGHIDEPISSETSKIFDQNVIKDCLNKCDNCGVPLPTDYTDSEKSDQNNLNQSNDSIYLSISTDNDSTLSIGNKTTEIIDQQKISVEASLEKDIDHVADLTNEGLCDENSAVKNLTSNDNDNSSKNNTTIEQSFQQDEDKASCAENTPQKTNSDDICNTININNLQTHIKLAEENESQHDVHTSDKLFSAKHNETEIEQSLQEKTCDPQNKSSNLNLDSLQNEKINLVNKCEQVALFEAVEHLTQSDRSKEPEVGHSVQSACDERNFVIDNNIVHAPTSIDCSSKEEYEIKVDDDVESMQCNSESHSSNRMSVDEDNTEMELDPDFITNDENGSCEMKLDGGEMSMEVN